LPERYVSTIQNFLKTNYSHLCIIEYDSIFLDRVNFKESGITCRKGGGGMPGFKAATFYHTPWFMDRETAFEIAVEGRALLLRGEYEGGSPDFFLGLILENLGIIPHESGTFSVNSLDTTNNMGLAKTALSEGCKFFHGIKSIQQLAELLK